MKKYHRLCFSQELFFYSGKENMIGDKILLISLELFW